MRNNSTPVGSVGYGDGYVMYSDSPDRIVGKILTLIDAMGLAEAQGKAAKDLVRQYVNNTFYDDGVYLSSETHTRLREEFYKKREENRNNSDTPADPRV